jgi:hypothetical protein
MLFLILEDIPASRVAFSHIQLFKTKKFPTDPEPSFKTLKKCLNRFILHTFRLVISKLMRNADQDPDPAYHFDADPDADPDPSYHFNADADPDPTFQFDADP